ncbi:MAG: MFS transporter [Dehalococcoidia bacterium]
MTGDVVETRLPRLRWELLTGGHALLHEDGFRQLWLGRLLSHTGLNMVLYTLLVLAVGDSGSGSSIKSALFITAYILPTATLGTISGVLVDRLPKNLVLAAVNVARLALMFLLIVSNPSLGTIYGVALLIAITSQFATPAEAAALPQLVRSNQLTSANSISNLGGLVSQIVGFAVLPALFLNTVGERPLFFVAGVLFGAGALVFLSIHHLGSRQIDIDSTIDAVQQVRKQFAQAWDTLNRDLVAYMAVIIVVLASTASLVAVTLMPRFVTGPLGMEVQNAIYVFAPAAVGVLAGLRLVQWLDRRLAAGWLLGWGFAMLAGSLFALGLIRPLGSWLEAMNAFGMFDPGPFGDTSARIILTAIFSSAAAFSFSVLGVASRSIVQQRMPMELQGRIFAAQNVLINLASIPPILLAGLLAEVFTVEAVLFLFVIIMVGAAGWAFARAAARPGPLVDAEAS